LGYDHHKDYDPQLKLDYARHLVVPTKQLGVSSLHEYRRDYACQVESDPLPQGDGVMAVLRLKETPKFRSWVNGREMTVGESRIGQFRLFDLRHSFRSEVLYAFHSVHLFIPNTAFDRSVGKSPNWNWELNAFCNDPVLEHVVRAMIPAVRNPQFQDKLFSELVLQATSRHIASEYADLGSVERSSTRSLSKAQEARAKDIMVSRIEGNVSVDEIAAECGVSADHFSRTFKWSTGLPPYRWLTLQRVERAKSLLQGSGESLADIALTCGFSNQSHLTRVFSREVGLSPGKWRRHRNA
jgi:AraC family transcriptional regulator